MFSTLIFQFSASEGEVIAVFSTFIFEFSASECEVIALFSTFIFEFSAAEGEVIAVFSEVLLTRCTRETVGHTDCEIAQIVSNIRLAMRGLVFVCVPQ